MTITEDGKNRIRASVISNGMMPVLSEYTTKIKGSEDPNFINFLEDNAKGLGAIFFNTVYRQYTSPDGYRGLNNLELSITEELDSLISKVSDVKVKSYITSNKDALVTFFKGAFDYMVEREARYSRD
jgi:hypothetical protein